MKRFLILTIALVFTIQARSMAEAFCYTVVQTTSDSWRYTITKVNDGSSGNGPLYYSTDAGATWQPASLPLVINTGSIPGAPNINNVRLQRHNFVTGAPTGPIYIVSPC